MMPAEAMIAAGRLPAAVITGLQAVTESGGFEVGYVRQTGSAAEPWPKPRAILRRLAILPPS